MTPLYPPTLPIEPLTGPPPRLAVTPPGSKSITNRALVLAALASSGGGDRPNRLVGCLRSEDTEVMIAALRRHWIAHPLISRSRPEFGRLTGY